MSNPFTELSRYEYVHLTAHLAELGLGDDLERLLAFETEDRRNAWFDLKQSGADLDSFLKDVEQARRMAAGDEISQVARAVRHATLLSSVSSITRGLPTGVIAAAVKQGLWPAETAWKHANLLSDSAQRSKVVVDIAPHLTQDLAERILIYFTGRKPLEGWVNVVVSLAPRLKPKRLQAAVEPHFAYLYRTGDIEAFARLSQVLPETSYSPLLGVLKTEFWSSGRISEIIAAVAHRLPEALLPSVVALLGTDFPNYGQEAWAALAPRLPLKFLDQALRQVELIQNKVDQDVALSNLLPRLVQLGEPERAIQLARQNPDRDFWPLILKVLPPLAATGLAERALALVDELPSEHYRAQAITSMAAFIPSEFIGRALSISRDLTKAYPRVSALCALAPRLALPSRAEMLVDALLAVPSIEGSNLDTSGRLHGAGLTRARALSSIIPLFLELEDVANAREALHQLFEIPRDLFHDRYDQPGSMTESDEYGSLKAVALGQLLPKLENDVIDKLMSPRHLSTDYLRGVVLADAGGRLDHAALKARLEAARSIPEIGALARHAPKSWLGEILHDARPKFHQELQSELIGTIAPHLNPPLLQEALEISRSVNDPLGRAVAIAGLSCFLNDMERLAYAERALASAQEAGPLNDGARSQALADIAPYLPLPTLRRAIVDAKALAYDFLRDQALGALLPALAGAGAVEEAWSEAKLLDGSTRAEILCALIPLAPNGLIHELSQLEPWIDAGFEGQTLLFCTAERLPAQARQILIDQLLVRAAEDGSGMSLLSVVAHHTPEALRKRVQRAARLTDRRIAGATILGRLAGVTAIEDRLPLLAEALERLAPPDYNNELTDAVAAIGAATVGGRLDDLLDRVRSWPNRLARDEALATLATYLDQNRVNDLLVAMGRSRDDPHLLAALVVRLAQLGAVQEALSRYLTLPSWIKGDILGELAPFLSTQDLNSVLVDAQYLEDDYKHRSRALSAIGPHLGPDLLVRGLEFSMQVANKFHRRPAIQVMVRTLLHVPGSTRLHALHRALEIGAERHRSDFLYDLGSLAPLVADIQKGAAVAASLTAVTDCVRWWR